MARRVLTTLVAMMFAVALSAQNLTVNGVVTDSHDESVIGACL